MNSMNTSRESKSLGLNPQDAFPECKSYPYFPGYGIPQIFPLKKDELLCFTGSCMLAAKGDYEATNALPTKNGESYEYVKSEPIKNALVSLGTVTGNMIPQEPVTKVKCLSEDGCRIQAMHIPPSLYVNYKQSLLGITTDVTVGVKSIVSTIKKGKLNLDLYISGKTYGKTYVESTADTTNGLIVTPDLKIVTYKRDKYFDFAINQQPTPKNNHQSRSGTINKSDSFYIVTGMNFDEIQTYVNTDTGSLTATVSGSNTFEWEPVKAGSDAENKTEWYYPEITATLSTKGGAYTKENVNQKYPGHHGLSLTWIIVIGVGCFVVLTIIIVVGVIVHKKIKHMDEAAKYSTIPVQ
ncbi:hypothetical protein TVAG_090760 [Trichomonas vaginalis G3]|uniref:Uncharacterized protein n=1 Tax=Trichomonas vaginalis (strain ATCC PRA-98 / G3) TaxID=412133 RepID=A2F913_TRIV3|nr:glycoprotein 38 family [Trichomonas vaginalis G3]EAX98588.1 hypothetical protein TVAG_090760 [Trichomonas vaginalis G3]KAI5498377.1 glycoprotein 38 family [Trichomonas vaginalis G3]|eukprot:XP_001311518.1 hypothetical protein [Trichomonas vaginalis G3]